MKTFEGRVVIVTGASSGLGEAAALNFARHGAKVVIAARRVERGENVVRQIEALGGEALFIRTDVTKSADVQALVDGTMTKFGRLDCAVNNAGITGPEMTPVAEIEEEAWDQLMDTNLKAVWMCMKYEIPAMLTHGRGAIVNISSIYGFKPGDIGNAPYCASKFAVIGLSKTAAIDYARQAIRVNVVAPALTHSEMVTPYLEKEGERELIAKMLSRHSAREQVCEAAEIAEAITWLCSDAASFVNGAVLAIDGGETSRLY
jgi:NAD(P)-dependent dehydrogenase (short-subunit alcohol dehydrogenase family)